MKTKTNNLIKAGSSAQRAMTLAVILAVFSFGTFSVQASDTTQMSQSITGALDVAIVDGSGNIVANPNVAFSSKAFSMIFQSSTATLGAAGERLRVTNPSGSTDTWTLSIAATGGTTTTWTNGVNTYDYNDPTASAGDGADTDSVGGQMTIDPSAGTIAGVGGTNVANVSKGSSFGFSEGTKNSIDLVTAASGAQKPGQWDFTGAAITQTIPGGQATGSYSIDMTLTAV
jgi:hypothetical protein